MTYYSQVQYRFVDFSWVCSNYSSFRVSNSILVFHCLLGDTQLNTTMSLLLTIFSTMFKQPALSLNGAT